MYNVQFASKRVKKEFGKLNKQDRGSVEEALSVLSEDPRPDAYQFSKLNRNKDVKRIRCKRARVFYIIDENSKTVHIGHMDIRNSKSYSADPKHWFAAVS